MANNDTILQVVNTPTQFINAATETALLGANGTALTVNASDLSNVVAGKTFVVRFVGRCTGGTGATLSLALYLGNVGTGTKIATYTVSGAAIPAAGGNFSVAATLTWDQVSGKLNGTLSGHINNTVTTVGAITQATVVSPAGLAFSPSATFGAATATNSVTVVDFNIEQI